jgi:hypothetical protein
VKLAGEGAIWERVFTPLAICTDACARAAPCVHRAFPRLGGRRSPSDLGGVSGGTVVGGARCGAQGCSSPLNQPTKDLRNPIAENAHFRAALTTGRIDQEYFQRLRAVLLQHDNQITAINRRAYIEVERMD